jgi:DNA-binding winged helix-turn-helix (wHTH) protein
MIYVFGDYELDTQRYELRGGGVPCALERQGFNVLVYLLQHRDRVVAKDELLEQLWPNQIVSENTLGAFGNSYAARNRFRWRTNT